MKKKSLKVIITSLVLALFICSVSYANTIQSAITNVTEDAANKTIEYAKDQIDKALDNGELKEEIDKIKEDYETFKNKNWFMRLIDNIINFFKNLFNPSRNKEELLDKVNEIVKETKTNEIIEEKTNDTKKYIEDFVNKELEVLNDNKDKDENNNENKNGINININFGNINIEDQSKNIEEASKLIKSILNKNENDNDEEKESE